MTMDKHCDYFEDHNHVFTDSTVPEFKELREGIRLSYYKDHDNFYINVITCEIADSYGSPAKEPNQGCISMTTAEMDQFIIDLIKFRFERKKHVGDDTG